MALSRVLICPALPLFRPRSRRRARRRSRPAHSPLRAVGGNEYALDCSAHLGPSRNQARQDGRASAGRVHSAPGFCPRQCALIHVERLWAENRLTAEGRVLHERTDDGRPESRDGIRILRSVHVASTALGVWGVADVVELRVGEPYPVEYKRGRPKAHRADEVQLCAQAICLEEMTGRYGTRGRAVLWPRSAAHGRGDGRRPARADGADCARSLAPARTMANAFSSRYSSATLIQRCGRRCAHG